MVILLFPRAYLQYFRQRLGARLSKRIVVGCLYSDIEND
jgi:hypothetical protein